VVCDKGKGRQAPTGVVQRFTVNCTGCRDTRPVGPSRRYLYGASTCTVQRARQRRKRSILSALEIGFFLLSYFTIDTNLNPNQSCRNQSVAPDRNTHSSHRTDR
jgi:hypothetical protein